MGIVLLFPFCVVQGTDFVRQSFCDGNIRNCFVLGVFVCPAFVIYWAFVVTFGFRRLYTLVCLFIGRKLYFRRTILPKRRHRDPVVNQTQFGTEICPYVFFSR